MSTVCVTDAGRTRVTREMVWLVVAVKVPPCTVLAGTAVNVGRAPLKRYGGSKNWAEYSFVWPARPPLPATTTRPSGNTSDVEWYRRATAIGAIVVQVSVTGDQISASS